MVVDIPKLPSDLTVRQWFEGMALLSLINYVPRQGNAGGGGKRPETDAEVRVRVAREMADLMMKTSGL